MAEEQSPWMVVLKIDEHDAPWGHRVAAGKAFHMTTERRLVPGWADKPPALIVVRLHPRSPLNLEASAWLAHTRVWCHFGNKKSNHPSLDGVQIQRDHWPRVRERLFRQGQAPKLVVNAFSSSEGSLAWDRKLAELGRAVSVAIRDSMPLAFDLSSLDGPWVAATRRYYEDLVHVRTLEALRPLYLGSTDAQVAHTDLSRALEAGGLIESPYVQGLLARIPENRMSPRPVNLEILFPRHGNDSTVT